jgi:hypothetical protein
MPADEIEKCISMVDDPSVVEILSKNSKTAIDHGVSIIKPVSFTQFKLYRLLRLLGLQQLLCTQHLALKCSLERIASK